MFEMTLEMTPIQLIVISAIVFVAGMFTLPVLIYAIGKAEPSEQPKKPDIAAAVDQVNEIKGARG